jgi:hypothetical protein
VVLGGLIGLVPILLCIYKIIPINPNDLPILYRGVVILLCLLCFLLLFILLFIVTIVATFLQSLSCLCPKCGNRIIKGGRTWSVDSRLIGRPCSNCKFRFEKPAPSGKEDKSGKERKDFLEYFLPYPGLFVISIFLAMIALGIYGLASKTADFGRKPLFLVAIVFFHNFSFFNQTA